MGRDAQSIEIRWDATPRARWERLCAAPALQQSWAYGEAMRAIGVDVRRAEARRAGRTVALLQATSRRLADWATLALAARGPIWTAALDDAARAEVARAVIASSPFERPRVLIMSPAEPAAGWTAAARLRRIMTGDSTARLTLDRADDALRAAMRGKWRNRLVAAERAGRFGRVRPLSPTETRAFVQLEAEQRRSRRYASLPVSFTQAYGDVAGRGGVLALGAVADGDLRAGMLFLRHGAAATYHLGWADDAARAGGAHNLILWDAMRRLRDMGVRELDMGGLDTERTPGIARFKLGAGAQPTTFAGSFV